MMVVRCAGGSGSPYRAPERGGRACAGHVRRRLRCRGLRFCAVLRSTSAAVSSDSVGPCPVSRSHPRQRPRVSRAWGTPRCCFVLGVGGVLVLKDQGPAVAKSGIGEVEMIHIFKIAKDADTKSRTQTINQLCAIQARVLARKNQQRSAIRGQARRRVPPAACVCCGVQLRREGPMTGAGSDPSRRCRRNGAGRDHDP